MDEWKKLSQPPKWALKEISAGRLKGKSDINPQWRYYAMTEVFGMVGKGWKYTIEKMWTETGADNEVLAFALVSVYVNTGGAWSDAIPGVGGSTLIAKEKGGMYNNDEAFKMAITDALSTALKMIGVASDVYMGLWDGAKYREIPKEKQSEPTEAERKDKAIAAFADLVKRAKSVKLELPPMDAGWSIEKMTAHYKEQKAFVVAAEEQAKAGE